MATKSVSAAAKGAEARARYSGGSNWEQASFIQRELNSQEQQACKEWEFPEEEAFATMQRLCDSDYKVTFRRDDYNHCFACWLLPPKDHADNAGLILTGRGSSSYKAFKQAYYKHAILFSELWPRDGDDRSITEIDD